MSGETIKTLAICLAIHPWSRTSHVVVWLTPEGLVRTAVKGAVRPKSAFLGQYDLNYTCEILYYARAHGELHALRECVPVERRDELRADYRALAAADYARFLLEKLTPQGEEAKTWFDHLAGFLDGLSGNVRVTVARLVAFELKTLDLLGLRPEVRAAGEGFLLCGERPIAVSKEVAAFLRCPDDGAENSQTPLDAARVIGVFYKLHLDFPSDVRRSVLGLISKTTQES